jgi:hypothetical protein
MREVEEGPLHHATIPRLVLRRAGGGRVVARDVRLWRVNSLEDTRVGTAVLLPQLQVQV